MAFILPYIPHNHAGTGDGVLEMNGCGYSQVTSSFLITLPKLILSHQAS